MVPILVVFLLLVCVLPTRQVLPGLGAAGRPSALLAVALFGWWALVQVLPDRRASARIPIRWGLTSYLLVHLAAVVAGLDRGLPGAELRSMDRFALVAIGIAGIILVCIDGLDTVRQVELVIAWIVGLGALSATVGIIQFATGYNPAELFVVPGLDLTSDIRELATRGDVSFRRASGLTLHSIELGVVMGAILPMSFYLARARSSSWYCATVLIAAVIPMSITRTGVLAVVVSMTVYALGWSWRERLTAMSVAAVGVMVYSAIVPGLLGTLRALFVRIEDDNSTTGRTEDFAAVGHFISDRPWLGRGPGTFLPGRYRLLDNGYLLELIEAGVLGLAALVLLMGVGCATAVWLVRRSDDRPTRDLARVFGGAAGVMLVGFATYDAMAYPTMLGILALSLGCLGALHRIDQVRRSHGRATR